MKTAKWCTRLSNWNVSGLDRIPQSFSFSLFSFFFFPPLFVRLPIPRTYYTRNRSISRTFAIQMNSAKSGMGKLAVKLCRIFPRKNTSFSVATFPNKGGDICVCVPKMRSREKNMGLKNSADLFPTIRVVRSANKRTVARDT